MDPDAVLSETMGLIADGKYEECAETCLALIADPLIDRTDEARLFAVLTFNEYYRGDFGSAVLAAERALAIAADVDTAEAWSFAVPAHVLAHAGLPPEPGSAVTDDAELVRDTWARHHEIEGLPGFTRAMIGAFTGEAALATGQVDTAAEVLEFFERDLLAALDEPAPINPMLYFSRLFPVRLAVAQGRISDALELCETALEFATASGHRVGIATATAVLAMIAGLRADRPLARALADTVVDLFPEPDGQLAANCHFLAAYGLSAAGDTARAAELVVRGGQGPDLPFVQTIDRALAYEILVTAAVEAGELDAARAWAERIVPLGGLPAAEPTVSRTLGRIELAIGNTASGADLAAVAEARARLGGNFLEAAMGSLLRAKSLAMAGVNDRAADRLTRIAHDADRLGGYAVRKSAARELRRLGRRLKPAPNAGWAGLSERERQIAVLAAEGYTNRIIGHTLFLSERTVQSHVSRVLASLDLPSRSALPRALVAELVVSQAEAAPGLTPRQWDIASQVALGSPNHQIAQRLGISVKTVEKHIGAIFLRWGVSSRTGIASRVVAETARSTA